MSDILIARPEPSPWAGPVEGWDEAGMRERALGLQINTPWRWVGGEPGWPCREGDERSLSPRLLMQVEAPEEALAQKFSQEIDHLAYSAYCLACGRAAGSISVGHWDQEKAFAMASALLPRAAQVALATPLEAARQIALDVEARFGSAQGATWLAWAQSDASQGLAAPWRAAREVAFEAAQARAEESFEDRFGEFRLEPLPLRGWLESGAMEKALDHRLRLLRAREESRALEQTARPGVGHKARRV